MKLSQVIQLMGAVVVVILSKSFPIATASINVTLDTVEDYSPPPPDALWILASYYPRYFEYYENTSEFENQVNNSQSCASHYYVQGIPEANGIWAACRSPMNTGECANISHTPCNPFIRLRTSDVRTVRITAIVENSAILRILVGEQCFDYGWVGDPNSDCQFKELSSLSSSPSNGGWQPESEWSRILFSLPRGETFGRFEISLVTRFEDDVILLDKIEATDSLLCDWDEPCSTEFPPTTTTPSPDRENVTLDTKADSVFPTPWNIVPEIKRYMEYYNDTSELRNNSENPDSCTHYMSHDGLNRLSGAEGIWVACQDPELPPECSAIPSSPCHPFFEFLGPSPMYRSVKVTFAIEGSAVLRLTFQRYSESCLDLSRRKDPFSLCRQVEINDSDLENGWTQVSFSLCPDCPYEPTFFRDVRLDLISRFQHDVILVDKVEVTPRLICDYPNACMSPTPSTLPTTTGTTGSSPITDPTSTVEETQFTDESSSSYISTATPEITSTAEEATTSTIKETEVTVTEAETTEIITVTTTEQRTTTTQTVTVTTSTESSTTPEESTTERLKSTSTTFKTTTSTSTGSSSSTTTEGRVTSEDPNDRTTTDSGVSSTKILIGNVAFFIIIAISVDLTHVFIYN